MVGVVVELLRPQWMLLGFFEIEQASIQYGVCGHFGIIGFDDARVGIQTANDFARRIHLFCTGSVDLVQNYNI